MPSDFYDSTRPEVIKLWAKATWTDYRLRSAMLDPANGMIGDDPETYPFVEINDFEKGPGDEITLTLHHLIGGRGAVGAEQLEGKETVTDTSTFKMKIDVLRHAVKCNALLVNKQRVPFNEMQTASRGLRDWHDERRTVRLINHLCGNSRQTDMAYAGNNTIAEPDSRHIYRCGYGLGASNDQTVGADTTALFDVDIIPELVTIAETMTPPLKPWIYKGNPLYGMYLHPNVVQQLRKSSSKWYDEAKAALQGGMFQNNPIFSRALGFKHGVVFFSEPYIPQGKNSSTGAAVSNCRRNVFFGAGAVLTGNGVVSKDGDKDALVWANAEWDFGMKYAVAGTMSTGCKAIRFADQTNTARDLGRIVVTSYAPEQAYAYQIANGPVGSYIDTYDKGQPQ